MQAMPELLPRRQQHTHDAYAAATAHVFVKKEAPRSKGRAVDFAAGRSEHVPTPQAAVIVPVPHGQGGRRPRSFQVQDAPAQAAAGRHVFQAPVPRKAAADIAAGAPPARIVTSLRGDSSGLPENAESRAAALLQRYQPGTIPVPVERASAATTQGRAVPGGPQGAPKPQQQGAPRPQQRRPRLSLIHI